VRQGQTTGTRTPVQELPISQGGGGRRQGWRGEETRRLEAGQAGNEMEAAGRQGEWGRRKRAAAGAPRRTGFSPAGPFSARFFPSRRVNNLIYPSSLAAAAAAEDARVAFAARLPRAVVGRQLLATPRPAPRLNYCTLLSCLGLGASKTMRCRGVARQGGV